MEQLLNAEIAGQIKEVFAQMKEPVQILFFGAGENYDYCDDTRQLLAEVAALDSRIGLSQYDHTANADIARHFNVDKAPGLVIAAKDGDQVLDFGFQYTGISSGHKFGGHLFGRGWKVVKDRQKQNVEAE